MLNVMDFTFIWCELKQDRPIFIQFSIKSKVIPEHLSVCIYHIFTVNVVSGEEQVGRKLQDKAQEDICSTEFV